MDWTLGKINSLILNLIYHILQLSHAERELQQSLVAGHHGHQEPGKLSGATGIAINPTTQDVAVMGTEVQQVRIYCNDPPL